MVLRRFWLGLLLFFAQENQGYMNIVSKQLKNGLQIFVVPNHMVPKVSMQLWYRVGSKDETDGQKGIAHLIEHMIFKGTKEMLSETDIKQVVHTLSGDSNAFTSYDYTGYLFNLPSQHWEKMLPIMADCMVNVAFKDEHLNSEMQAVIQELKMIKDDHARALIFDLLNAVFPDHPYHYPLIGYKHDLWSVTAHDLQEFYKKHYLPNNATLVVVGDVEPDHVFEQVEHYFGAIPARFDYKKDEHVHMPDIGSTALTVYRDVKQPIAIFGFKVPGVKRKVAHILDVLSLVLAQGKSSRLHKILVDDRRLAAAVATFNFDLFDHGLFFVYVVPKCVEDLQQIEHIILEQIQDISKNGLTNDELAMALKKAKMIEFSLLENNEKQAYHLAKYYLATNDPWYGFKHLDVPVGQLKKEILQFVKQYFRPSVMNKGYVLPLAQADHDLWESFQESSDQEDNAILAARKRTAPVEGAKYAKTVRAEAHKDFNFPKAQKAELENGVKLLWYNNKNVPKITIKLEFKAAGPDWDPEDKQGLFLFVTEMMTEGTKHYSAAQLAEAFESRGMSFEVQPGGVSLSMLKEDFEKGLELLVEVLTGVTFCKNMIEKVRQNLEVQIKYFWDNPEKFAFQLLREVIYTGHPYAKNGIGTAESIASITRNDLIDFYKTYIVPDGATCAIVGDIGDYDIEKVVANYFKNWQGASVPDMEYPEVQDASGVTVDYPINRDQITVLLGHKSVDRKSSDYDALLILNQIFGSSMHSRLFQLREQTGLFYVIGGSTLVQSGLQPGMAVVRTLVSKDKEQEAIAMIKKTMKNADVIAPDELVAAKNAVVANLIGGFESNAAIASSFLFLERYGFASDYFDHRAREIDAIELEQIKSVAKKYLDPEKMCTIRVGRVA